MKRYVAVSSKRSGDNTNYIKIETNYDKGGMNVFTYRNVRRGYYLSVIPVNRSTQNGVAFESFVAFTGKRMLLKEVSRKSQKAEIESENLAESMYMDVVNMVCAESGLEIKED